MDRRLALTSLAVASGAALVGSATGSFAQTKAMGEAETKHDKDTATVGSLSLAASRVAVQKATNADVKKFANWEVAEQETISDILASMKMEKAQGALKIPTDAEVEAMLDAEGKASLEKLKGLTGAEFDKAYVKAQTEGHQKLLTIQETYLKSGADREHLDVAKLARGMIKEHLDHLADLAKV